MWASNAKRYEINRYLWPLSRFISKMIQYDLQLQRQATSKLCVIWCHFQWPWTTLNPDLKVTVLFDAGCLINSTRYIYNGILIRDLYTLTLKGVISNDFGWLSEIFNDRKHRAVSVTAELLVSFLGVIPRTLPARRFIEDSRPRRVLFSSVSSHDLVPWVCSSPNMVRFSLLPAVKIKMFKF